MRIITNKIYICLHTEKELDKLDWDGLSTEEYNGKTYYKIASGGSSSDVVKKITFETLKDNITVTLNIVSSSEERYDFAYACELDGTSGFSNAKYKISGNNQSITCEYAVPTKGAHWIYIGYRKDGSGDRYNDCGYFFIDNSDKEYVIRQPKEVYLASNKMNEITYGSKKILEYGKTNTISWETLTWDESNNIYTYNTNGPIKMYYKTTSSSGTSTTTLNTSPSKLPLDGKIYKLDFYPSIISNNTYIMPYKIDLSDWDNSYVHVISGMFDRFDSLNSINLSKLTNENITSTKSMFYGCKNLTTLDLYKFNTSKVTNMNSMFYDCEKLAKIDVSGFDTSNVTDMEFMFNGCSSLTSLDLSNFNTTNVKSMGGMFNGCSSITSLDLSNFNTTNVESMGAMFFNCTKLSSLNVSSFDTSKVYNMYRLFAGCSSLTSLDLSNWDASNVNYSDADDMFKNCSELKTLIAGHESETNVTALNGLKVDIDLSDCTKLNGQSISAVCSGLANLPSDNKKTITVSKTKEGDISVQIAMLNASIKNWNTVYK